jgi:sulfoxide reductase heme-binding subunit YedZ
VRAILLHPVAKPLVFVASLLPLAWLLAGAFADRLGANPAEYLIRATGDWTLRFLCLVLAVTPLRVVSGSPALARFRRMLGLMVYFYATAARFELHRIRHGVSNGDMS